MSNVRSLGLVVALALGASCVVGAPPGFSSGTQWTFPLVDPLSNGLLVTAVTIKGHGPYLFVIDPEVATSVIDERVVLEAGLRTDRGYSTRLRGDDGVLRPRFNAELRDVRIGNLSVEVRRAYVVPHETLAGLGRDIRGVLGRKFIEDSLVFGFDRDRGIAWLQTVAQFSPHAGATKVGFQIVRAADDNKFGNDGVDGTVGDNRTPEITTRADVGGKQLTLDVTLGSVASRLRPEIMSALGLGPATRAIVEVDATGARRQVAISSTFGRIALGALSNDRASIGTYVNRDEMKSSSMFLDGTLGLDFFAPFDVAANWDAHALYLTPRGDAAAKTAERIGRWPELAGCAHVGCVTVSLVDPTPGAPSPEAASFAASAPAASEQPLSVLHVARDRGTAMPLEVRLRATDRTDLPDLVVELPAGATELLAPVHDAAHGAHYAVIDASPFAVPCANASEACVR
jgi:hypothetical protein